MRYRVISADDHVSEASGTWVDRVPRNMRDKVPSVREIDGVSTWTLNGQALPRLAPPRNDGELEARRAKGRFQTRPGDWDAKERLRDYDADGVDAAALFPNFATFTGNPCPWVTTDKKIQLECVKAYNDWLADDFCAADRRRLIPLALIPSWDVDLAIAEAHRAARKGHRGMIFGAALDVFGYPATWDGYWNDFYATVEGLGVPLVLHQPSAALDRAIFHDPRSALPPPIRSAASINHVQSLMYPVVELLLSGILVRHPHLQVQFAESGASWLLYTLHQCDYLWPRYGRSDGSELKMLPSEYFRRQCVAGFWSDVITRPLLKACGVDNLMWEGDYLHSIATFPNSRQIINQSLVDVADSATRAKVLAGNAVRLYRLTED